MRLKHCALLLFAAAAGAQPFTAGVKAGIPLTNFVGGSSAPSDSLSQKYLVGGTAEVRLPLGLAIEVDALYRHFHYPTSYYSLLVPGGSGSTIALLTIGPASAWEFPVLLKYRFPGRRARPFADAGPVWDISTGLPTCISQVLVVNPFPPATSPPAASASDPNFSRGQKGVNTGIVIGAGLDINFTLHIMPELRYTRWTSQHFNISDILHSNQNQAEFMVGLTF